MDFSEIIGQKNIKALLPKTIESSRIPHAQLFVGDSGSGPLPIAITYAKSILCHRYTADSTEAEICGRKVDKLSHPDLHFVYPVNTNDDIKKHPVSALFSEEWRQFVLENPYASLFDWLQNLGIENKQGIINVKEAEEIAKRLSLKSFEGGYKVMIIWMADKMNPECANKILKILEEPPEKTVLLLITENDELILDTIKSRCQKLHFPLLTEAEIAQALEQRDNVDSNLAQKISRQAHGDYNKARHILSLKSDDSIFEKWFVWWVRSAFRAKGNKKAINDLLDWSDELAGQGRETQKKYLTFCLEVFRQAMLKNYNADSLVFFEAEDETFNLDKFAPFVHQNNIFEISQALEAAIYHIERNGNPKLIFTDLSIQLTRLIHVLEAT